MGLVVNIDTHACAFRSSIAESSVQHFMLGEFEGVFCIVVTLTFSLAMAFRVAKKCHYEEHGIRYSHTPTQYSWWLSKRVSGDVVIPPALSCNPNYATGGLPLDSVMLMYLLPLVTKLCLKGTHKYAMLLSLLIATGFLIFATTVQLGDGGGNLWIIFNSTVIYSFIAYELERSNIYSFLMSKLALEDALAAERVKYEQDALMLLSKKDQATKEQEHDLLRSLIGNVAHDLKTPLLALTMGLEQLEPLLASKIESKARKGEGKPVSGCICIYGGTTTIVRWLHLQKLFHH
jgi:hypothetical protein